MLVAQVCPRYYPYIGGVETHVKEISERLVMQNINVEVLTTDPSCKLPEEEIINGVKVRRFKSYAPGDNYHFSTQLKRYLAINSNLYDVIHAHSYHDFPALYVAKSPTLKRFIFTPHYHGKGHSFFRSLLHLPYRMWGKKIFERADKVICVSNYEKNLILDHFREAKEKTIVIPNGVNLSEFPKYTKMVSSHHGKVVLYVGRLEKYKGVQNLIRVLPLLGPNTTLQIVGNGPYKSSLVNLTKKLCQQNNVQFFERLEREELLRKYVNADVFVLLSSHEAYSICVAEALASQTPCRALNVQH